MRPFNRSLVYAALLLASPSITLFARKPSPSVVQAEQVLAHKKTFAGRIISVKGFVKFDRPSEQGFLYSTIKDLQSQNYRRAIFLELGNEGFASLRIPDGRSAIVTGYLSKGLRGPLGAYPAHIIVDRIKVLR
jgi:hypothetical protein